MMKKLFFGILFLLALNSQAQESSTKEYRPIDYKALERQFNNDDFEADYITLLKRYQDGDSTLDIDQKRLVYFGSVFQESYNPYYSNEQSQELNDLVKKEKISETEINRIQQIALEILTENPFEINSLYTLANYYYKSGDVERSNQYLNRIMTIFDAIFSTGSGLSTEEPLYVTQITHEYEVLGILNLPYSGKQSLVGSCDYLEVENDEVDGLYFEVTAPFLFLTDQFSN